MKPFSYLLLLAFLLAGAAATPALAQDDQEYKRVYNEALEAARAKDYNTAYTKYEQAVKLAKTAGDDGVVQSASKVLGQLDYLRGKKLIDQEKYTDAMKHFDKGIAHLPNYANNYLGKAIALKKLDRTDDALAVYVTLVDLGKETSDNDAVRKGQEAIRGHYVVLASTALAQNSEPTAADANAALSHLTKLQEQVEAGYAEEDADLYFYQAVAHNALGNYTEAAAQADKALELHRGSKTDKAKLFFVKGEALMYQGNVAAAKEAFSNATFGSYKSLAEHYLETL